MTQLIEEQITEPNIRAGVVRDLLEHLDTYSNGLQRDVRAAVPREILERIDSAEALSWLSTTDGQFVLEALWGAAGSEKAMDALASFVARFVRSPFVKNYFETTSTSVEALFHMAEIAWEMIYQGVGDLEVVDSGASSALLRLSEVDPDILLSREYLRAFAASFVGLLRASEVAGEVKVDRIDYDFQYVDFMIGWGNH